MRVAKLDVDESPATAARFGVRSIPTLLLIEGGREVDRIAGVQPGAEIERRLVRLIARVALPHVPGVFPGEPAATRV